MSRNARATLGLRGHALRNANLRKRSLARAQKAPPLARALVTIRAAVLGMTRLEFARRSGIGRGTLRDLELGIHTPTRRTLQQFLEFCRTCSVAPEQLEEVSRLYAGPMEGLGQVIARLELRAGSSAELAHRVGISPTTLWEYRRGHFPLPLPMLRALCQVVGEDPTPVEALWLQAERQRLGDRGYPRPLAEFWALCTRAGYGEKDLPKLGLRTASLRRLRYLELPPWQEIMPAAKAVCRADDELLQLERLWVAQDNGEGTQGADPFGLRVQDLRARKGLSRRAIAELFGIRGRKPARLIQSIEEDGCYSAQVYPAGLAALLADGRQEQTELLELWQIRRGQFHRRHRPETRTELRLARELYGLAYNDMEPTLGYTVLEYQRIERGAFPLAPSACARILDAIHREGQCRVEDLLKRKAVRDAERAAWRAPSSVRELIVRLAAREGGVAPLLRRLRQGGILGLWAGRLRALAQGVELPPWPLLEKIGWACGVEDLEAVRWDWQERYRARLHAEGGAPLAVEVRLLLAEVAMTAREFSKRLGVDPSALARTLQRMERGRPVKWGPLERILRAAGLQLTDRRWAQIHAWWYTTKDAG
jgi:transcriptional regulator with XRE-family HTH domain